MYDLSIIKYSLDNNNYNNISKYIDVKDLTQELQGIYRVVEWFHSEHGGTLTCDDLANYFFATQPKDKDFYIGVFETLKTTEVSTDSVVALAKSLKRASVLRKLAETSYEASEGKEKPYEAVKALYGQLEELDNKPFEEVSDEFFTTDLEEIIAQQQLEPGLNWRLKSLREVLGPIRKGNFGVVMARVETGKTAFVLSEGSHLAEQADGYTLFLSNEEAGDAMMWRLYQATLNMTREQVLANIPKAKELFHQKIGHKLLFKDDARISATWVEKTCDKYKPKLIIVDQIDKTHGFTNDREDLRLGAIYQFYREIAKEYAPVIGVTQANGEGSNTKWLTMDHMSNSKTAKPAELDWLLGIGRIADSGYEKLRFMNVDKNKLPGGPETKPEFRHRKWETVIDTERVRYLDL